VISSHPQRREQARWEFLSSDPDRLPRFEQKARISAALNHPNILAVHQMGTFEGMPYPVSELLEGELPRSWRQADLAATQPW
jgi:hypothetical protein